MASDRVTSRAAVLGYLLAILLSSASSAEAWRLSAEDRAALARREVVVHSEALSDQPATARGREIRAAIRIRAPAKRVFAAMTHCETAIEFVPHLQQCVLLDHDEVTGAEIIEHVVDYGWYAPSLRYTFRVEYVPDRSVIFRAVSGDLARNEGRWELTPLNEDPATGVAETLLTYRVLVVPKFRIPQSWVRVSLTRELPRMLQALRDFSERGQ
ncbi:MAG: SRPBCC family protein [Steroidobacteraceae bacterium]